MQMLYFTVWNYTAHGTRHSSHIHPSAPLHLPLLIFHKSYFNEMLNEWSSGSVGLDELNNVLKL